LLIYAPLTVRCKNLEETLDLISVDVRFKDEIEEMEQKLVEERDRNSDFCLPTNFNLLLSMPMRHMV
jgi:hypothetical protein